MKNIWKELYPAGMTLIEIVVSLAIIAIIAVGFLTAFSTGARFVSDAGRKTGAGFRAFGQAEITLEQKDKDPAPSGLVMTFSSDNSTVTSEGNVETFTDSNVSVTIFQPKY